MAFGFGFRKISTKYEKLKEERKLSKDHDNATSSKSTIMLSRSLLAIPAVGLSVTPRNLDEIGQIRQLITSREYTILKRTWKQLNGRSSLKKMTDLFARIFEQTITRSPPACHVFSYSSLLKGKPNNKTVCFNHGQKMAVFLEFFITNRKLETQCEFFPSKIGRIHVEQLPAGFLSEIWEIFGQCLAETMTLQEPVRRCPNGARTWNKLIAIITDRLRAGFDQGLKEVKQEPSSQATLPKSRFKQRKSLIIDQCQRIGTPHLQRLRSRLQSVHASSSSFDNNEEVTVEPMVREKSNPMVYFY